MSDKFNNIIKEHVEQHAYDIDPQEIWNGINEKTKKRRPVLWIWLVGFALISLTAVGVYSSLFKVRTTPSLATTTPISIIENDIENIASAARHNNTNNSIPTHKKLDNPTPRKSATTTNLNLNKNILKPQIEITQSTTLLNTSELLKPKQKVYAPLSPSGILRDTKEVAENITAITPLANSDLEFSTIPILVAGGVSSINIKQFDLEFSPSDYSHFTQPLSYSKLSLSFRSGLFNSDRNIEGANSESIALLESSESTFSSFNSDLMLHYSVGRKLSFAVGLSYQNIVNYFDWSGVLLADAQGDFISLYDESAGLPSLFTDLYYESVERTIQYYNETRLIDIPVQLEYQLADWKLRPILSMGATFNLYNSFAGYELDSNGVPSFVENTDRETKIGIRYKTSLALEYPVTPSLLILGEISGSMRTIQEKDLRLNYNWYGLNIGLKYSI